MHPIKIGSSKLAEWHNLIVDATSIAERKIGENLEYYLIITLDAFTCENKLMTKALATDFLSALDLQKAQSNTLMRSVGDQCLLISGLFPEQANRRNVSLDYYISMGQQAYGTVAIAAPGVKTDHQLFLQLSTQFTDLMQILRAIRVMPLRQLLLRIQ